jgi:hypothetical protein
LVGSGALDPAGGDSELERLRAENARLIALLTAHGIRWQAVSNVPMSPGADPLTTEQKVALFGRLFRGRTDAYPVRWAFARSCRDLGVSVALEVSRSGEGAHAWVFFSSHFQPPDKPGREDGSRHCGSAETLTCQCQEFRCQFCRQASERENGLAARGC